MKKFDAASRALIAAAHFVEERHYMLEHLCHTLTAVRVVTERDDIYTKTAMRLLQCNGPDLLDLSVDETIDILVAAAYWEDD